MADNRIPLLLCGKIPTHQRAVTEAISEKFNVLRICPSVEDIHQAVADYFTNSTASPKPRVIIMGGGFTQKDFEAAIAARPEIAPALTESADVPEACQVVWFRPVHFAPGGSGRPPTDGPPPAEHTAKLCRDGLWKHEELIKGGQGRGTILYF